MVKYDNMKLYHVSKFYQVESVVINIINRF